jgi:hypothetical protein
MTTRTPPLLTSANRCGGWGGPWFVIGVRIRLPWSRRCFRVMRGGRGERDWRASGGWRINIHAGGGGVLSVSDCWPLRRDRWLGRGITGVMGEGRNRWFRGGGCSLGARAKRGRRFGRFERGRVHPCARKPPTAIDDCSKVCLGGARRPRKDIEGCLGRWVHINVTRGEVVRGAVKRSRNFWEFAVCNGGEWREDSVGCRSKCGGCGT